MRKLDPKSAGGPDGVPPIFLKSCKHSLSPPLAHLFSLSYTHSHRLQVGGSPTLNLFLRRAIPRVSQIYRPISLTSTTCKLMESIIKDILCSSLLLLVRISKHQHAFITKLSTTTKLKEGTYDWRISLNNHNPVDVLYIDFSQAFDSVVHSKLIFQLRKIGLPDLLLSWIGSPLSYQINSNKLELKISSRMSQESLGSVIGPILFILFINDLGYVLSDKVSFKLFADDLKIS